MEAHFPSEIGDLESKVTPLAEYQTTRQKLSAELADHSTVIRGLIVRAEDARLMGDLWVGGWGAMVGEWGALVGEWGALVGE